MVGSRHDMEEPDEYKEVAKASAKNAVREIYKLIKKDKYFQNDLEDGDIVPPKQRILVSFTKKTWDKIDKLLEEIKGV